MFVLYNTAERTNDVRLILKIHGEIRILPVTKHPETNEILALPFNLLAGVVTTGLSERGDINLDTGLANFLFDIQFNWQAMAIPTRHIRCIKATQGLALDDNIFQHLVDGVTDMDIAVGIGRAVMQHKFRTTFACASQLPVDIHFIPTLKQCRFPIWQVAFHRESGVGKIQRVFIVSHVSVTSSAQKARFIIKCSESQSFRRQGQRL